MREHLGQQRAYSRKAKTAALIWIVIFTIWCLFLLQIFKNSKTNLHLVQLRFPLRAAEYLCYTSGHTFADKLARAVEGLTRDKVLYDPSYFVIDYPGGEIPADRGVCTDVIVRAYRKLGIDLQVEVHEDIKKTMRNYPRVWSVGKPDTNVDHRRVCNLLVFFGRRGITLPITRNPSDYKPGDIVVWRLSASTTHIGMVSRRVNHKKTCYLIVHNIGLGQVLEDVLFKWPIIGHYRYNKEN
ncbi:MAG: DUF1287 domain-containing protein [Spirochaetales bacterium]|nr:DUF1287 domain-containing protein [Spirochaetales bacterium]